MILSNFASLCVAKMTGAQSSPYAKTTAGADINGTVSINTYNPCCFWRMYGTTSNDTRIVLGDSDTPVTVDDYALGNDITSSLSFVSGITGPTRTAKSDFPSITAAFKNNTANAITVKEVGVMTGYNFNNSSQTGQCLIARKLITPVTIQPGESYAFTYSMSLG